MIHVSGCSVSISSQCPNAIRGLSVWQQHISDTTMWCGENVDTSREFKYLNFGVSYQPITNSDDMISGWSYKPAWRRIWSVSSWTLLCFLKGPLTLFLFSFSDHCGTSIWTCSFSYCLCTNNSFHWSKHLHIGPELLQTESADLCITSIL